MKASEHLNELATALCKAQGELENVAKDSNNPFFKSKYADLAACIDTVRPHLAANGLSIVQVPELTERNVRLVTRVLHNSGQWIEGELESQPKDFGPQAVGSVVTYLRRYMLSAMIGLAAEDDDGESGQGRGAKAATTTEEPKQRNTRGKFSAKETPAEPVGTVETPWGDVPPPEPDNTQETISPKSKAMAFITNAATLADVDKGMKRVDELYQAKQLTIADMQQLGKLASARREKLKPQTQGSAA